MIIVGDKVVCCAPKTGSTSLTQLAREHGFEHQTPGHQHEVEPVSEKTHIITVRDPRDRLVSLWRHYCGAEEDISLAEFLQRHEKYCLPKFYVQQQTHVYGSLFGVRPWIIRFERFAEDIEVHLEWKDPPHLNSTVHPPWRDCGVDWGKYFATWRDDYYAFGYSPA